MIYSESHRVDFNQIQRDTLNNIEQIAGQLGIKLRRGRGACLIHGGVGPNLSVTNGRGFHCFVCGAQGDAIDLIRLLRFPHLNRRAGRVAVFKELAAGPLSLVGSSPATASAPAPRPTPSTSARAFLTTLMHELQLETVGRQYLEGRCINADLAYARGVRSILDWGRLERFIRSRDLEVEARSVGFELGRRGFHTPYYARRGAPSLFFFYLDHVGPVGLTLRTLIGLTPKTLAMKGAPVVTPWGLDSATLPPSVLHVAEGEIDGLTLSHFGGPVIALPGGNSVPGGAAAPWVRTIAKANTVVLWTHQDEGGRRVADAFARAVLGAADDAPRIRVVTHDLPPLDVNDLVRAGFTRIVAEGMRANHE